MRFWQQALVACAVSGVLSVGTAEAGPIMLTGHDPDFHAQGQHSGEAQLEIGLEFVMGATPLDNNANRLLWVESFIPAHGGHVTGFNSLTGALGLDAGDFDVVDAAGFATLVANGDLNTGNYTAIAIASTFGGMLTSAELNALFAARTQIAAFINAGGGLWASAESESSTTVAPHAAFFSFLPITVLATGTSGQYAVTAYGASLGFTNADVNDCCTHNSFATVPSGLQVVDIDLGFGGIPTTLAGDVRIIDDVIVPGQVPEPATLSLLGLGLLAGVRRLRRRT